MEQLFFLPVAGRPTDRSLLRLRGGFDDGFRQGTPSPTAIKRIKGEIADPKQASEKNDDLDRMIGMVTHPK